MSRGNYERLPMYAASDSTPRLRSSSSTLSLHGPSAPSNHTYIPAPKRHRSSRSTTNLNVPGKSVFPVRPRTLFTILKFALPATFALLLLGLFMYEPHIELSFYSRAWIRKEITPVPPLAGCFDPSRSSSAYNVSDALYGPRRTEVQAGVPLRMGMDCYDFAGTVRGSPSGSVDQDLPADERTHYHTYWRNDLAPFGPRQEYMLKSFFATQPLGSSRLILWSNGDLSSNDILASYKRKYPRAFDLRVVDIPTLAVGTALEGHEVLKVKDSKAWVDGDLIRLLVIWVYGGVWVDMDSLLTRSLEPLLEHEFVTQWDCYDKIYQPLNGALMHFRKHSAYLCEAFHIMASSEPPRSGSTDWGALLYLKLWRRLVGASIPPFKVLPFCFSDARSCRLDNRLPDPFADDGKAWEGRDSTREGGPLDVRLGKVFGVHLHNQWEKAFPKDGWVERLLLRRFEQKLDGGADEL
ncbi:hypothetical protein PLICRDRAFT_141945 [Plicaturopsis crispa FD-325 SS-3]|nr:hypothetical protein PLICRDRAFT_141945 [Plicaturopsis crispa FD-325 SS-3]